MPLNKETKQKDTFTRFRSKHIFRYYIPSLINPFPLILQFPHYPFRFFFCFLFFLLSPPLHFWFKIFLGEQIEQINFAKYS